MKALGAVLALGLAACLGNAPVTEDEVILSFGPLGDADQWIADGTSPILIEIRTADQASLDPRLTATLVASAGAWQLADADAKTATVTMSSQREQRLWTPPTQSGTVSLKATIGMVTRATSLTLRNAPIQQVRLGRDGVLSATDASMLTITAHLDVANNGLPSINTPVSFAVQVNGRRGVLRHARAAQRPGERRAGHAVREQGRHAADGHRHRGARRPAAGDLGPARDHALAWPWPGPGLALALA
jgi:hypothetical protein